MGLSVSKITLTTGYLEKFTILPGTTEVLLELPESSVAETLSVFIKTIDGVDTTLTEGGVLLAGGAWTLKFAFEPTEQTLVMHCKATAALDAILSVWTR